MSDSAMTTPCCLRFLFRDANLPLRLEALLKPDQESLRRLLPDAGASCQPLRQAMPGNMAR